MNKVYLASPFFNDKERSVKATVLEVLNRLNMEIHDPQGPSHFSSWEQPNCAWGKHTFNNDYQAIDNSDFMVAIDWGLYGDCGTAWEIAYAYATKKPVIVVAPNETLTIPHSLMVVNGATNFISEARLCACATREDFDLILNGEYFLAGVEQK